MWEWIGGWFKALFGPKGATQIGAGNKSISGVTAGNNAGGVVVGDGNVVTFQQGAAADKPLDFADLEKLMPDLLTEMRVDLSENALIREFIVIKSTHTYNADPNNLPFSYYTDKHENLIGKVKLLEDRGLVRDVTRGSNTPRYRFTDAIVSYLTKVA